jgi:hypothetical protein
LSRGISTLIFFRLCWRAPLMMMFFMLMCEIHRRHYLKI